MTELTVRPRIGPEARRAPAPMNQELPRPFKGFKELLHGPTRPPLTAAEPPELRPPSQGEGIRPQERLGSGALDPEAPRRISSEPGSSPGPDPSSLEPFGLLLGSFAGYEQRTAVATPEPAGVVPDRVVGEVIKAIAWGGNQRRGAARIELDGERYGGTRLVVEVDGDELRLKVDAPAGVDTDELRARLAERFARRGLSLRDD